MRIWFFLGMPVALILACSTDEEVTNSETAHFAIDWEEGQATTEEIEETKRFAEEIYAKYEDYFGNDRLPQSKTIIHLGGNAFSGNGGNPKIPFVDENGEIFLYRFATGYLGELPHEYVHVLRLYQGWSSDGFLEEGLAEAMSSKLFPENVGFSLYGFSTTIAAGLWLSEDRIIPLEKLKESHFDLNLKCLPQSYSLRADFFSFLLEEYGKEQFFKFIYANDARQYEGYERAFEKTLEELQRQWLQNLQQRLDMLIDEETQTQAYKTRINSLNFYICKSGTDF